MRSCIYAGSFDPFHEGHANIVKRALKAFDCVHILIATNPKKTYLLRMDYRMDVIKHSMKGLNVEVHHLPENSLVSDYAKEKGITSILKGIRNIQDTEYEKMLHEVTVSQENGIDTFILFSNPIDQKISSSAIKELIKYNADVRDYIPLFTKQLLEVKQNGQLIIGITGGIGAGKSYITDLMVKYFFKDQQFPRQVINVDLDKIANDITYSDSYNTNNEVLELRKNTNDLLEKYYINHTSTDLREMLSRAVFTNPKFNKELQQLYKPVIIREIRRQIAGIPGLIILNGALLIDMDMQYLCNNNIIVLGASSEEINKRLLKRYTNQTDVDNRISSQLTSVEKLFKLHEIIKASKFGHAAYIHTGYTYPISTLSEEKRADWLFKYLKDSNFWQSIGLNT
jgi:pantetheine-phosphate adenylyltransferase